MKATIEISDDADGETVNLKFDFDPAVTDDTPDTPASVLTADVLNFIMKVAEKTA